MPSNHGGKRAGAGRPPGPSKGRRTSLLKARATDAEKRAVAEHCERAGTTESELIRSRLADVIG